MYGLTVIISILFDILPKNTCTNVSDTVVNKMNLNVNMSDINLTTSHTTDSMLYSNTRIVDTNLNISIPNGTENNISSIVTIHNNNCTTKTEYTQLPYDEKYCFATDDSFLWVDATGKSTGWIRALGYYRLNETYTDFIKLTTNNILECERSCEKLASNQLRYFGFQKEECFCINNLEAVELLTCDNGYHKHCHNTGTISDKLFLYSRVTVDEYNQRCPAVYKTTNGYNVTYRKCAEDLPVLCIGYNTNSLQTTNIVLTSDTANSSEVVSRCKERGNGVNDSISLPVMTNFDRNCTFWIGLFHKPNVSADMIINNCVALIVTEGKLRIQVLDCQTSHLNSCQNYNNTTSIGGNMNGNICSVRNCLIYIIISVFVLVAVVFTIVTVYCSCRRRLRKGEPSLNDVHNTTKTNETFYSKVQSPSNENAGRRKMVVQSINNSTYNIDPESQQITGLISNRVNQNTGEYSGVYYLAKPTIATNMIDKEEKPSQYDLPMLGKNRNDAVADPTIEHVAENQRNVDRSVSKKGNYKEPFDDKNETEYNCLNHTRRQQFGNENTIYDKVKPGVLDLIKGETFVGTEYDSMANLAKSHLRTPPNNLK